MTLPVSDRDRRVFLDLDGAMSHAQVWLNGRLLGDWPYGYTSLRFELTPHLRFGAANVVAVRLDNPPKSSRWYPGAGIYRNVWLVKTAPVHLAHWGVFVTTPEVSPEKAVLKVQATIDNGSSAQVKVTVQQEVFRESDPARIVARTEHSGVRIRRRRDRGCARPARSRPTRALGSRLATPLSGPDDGPRGRQGSWT